MSFKAHDGWIKDIRCSPCGKYLCSASEDKTIKVWSFSTGTLVRTLEGHSDEVYKVLLASDNGYIISASYDSSIRIWNFDSGECV